MKHVQFGARGRDLYLDVPLSNVVIGYRPENMIADMIFPVIDVPKQSGSIIEFSQADALRRDDTRRAPGTEAKRVTSAVSSILYYCNNYALQAGVTIEDRANAEPVYVQRMLNGRATMLVDKLALDWEIRVALQVTSGSNVGSYTATASAWTGSGADPLANLNTAIDNVKDATGYRPNRVIFGDKAWRYFRRHSTVRNIIFGSNNGGGYPSIGQAAALLEVDNVLVGGTYYNSTQENIAKSLTSIWGDHVLVYYANPNPSQDRPSFAYTHRWAAPGIPNMQVERHPFNTRTKTDDIEVGYYQDEQITGAAFGFLITNTGSST